MDVRNLQPKQRESVRADSVGEMPQGTRWSWVNNTRQPETVFDSLYERYLPFRLYAEFMLGAPIQQLAREFALSEHWIQERIEAVRWCLEKQVRLNLLERAKRPVGPN